MNLITIILLVGTNETPSELSTSVQKIFHYHISSFLKKEENIKAASVVEKINESMILMVDKGGIHTKKLRRQRLHLNNEECGVFGVSFTQKISFSNLKF